MEKREIEVRDRRVKEKMKRKKQKIGGKTKY